MGKEEKQPKTDLVQFTPHQINIIRIWAEQPGIIHIAQELNLSEHTVQTHLKRMRRKLEVNRTFDIYQHMLHQGLL